MNKNELIKKIKRGESFALCYNAGRAWVEPGQNSYYETVEEVIREIRNAPRISDVTDILNEDDSLKMEFKVDLKYGARIYEVEGACLAIAIE